MGLGRLGGVGMEVDADGAGADAKFGAILKEGSADALSFKEGAVGGIEVLQVDKLAANFKKAVMARDFRVVQAEIGALAANNGATIFQMEFQALIGARSDGEDEINALRKLQAVIGRE